jgi:hypothetical protein
VRHVSSGSATDRGQQQVRTRDVRNFGGTVSDVELESVIRLQVVPFAADRNAGSAFGGIEDMRL